MVGWLSASEILTLCRSLRKTNNYKLVRRLLRDLRRERQFRNKLQRLLWKSNDRLLEAAHQRDLYGSKSCTP